MKFSVLRFAVVCALSFFSSIAAAAQNPAARDPASRDFSFSGTVRNSETGEALIGASIFVEELKTVGTSTNAYGFYSLTLPKGTYTVRIRFIGFATERDTIVLDHDRTINFNLHERSVSVGEVVVSAEHSNSNVTSTEISTNKLDVRELQSLPVLLGEKDVLKTIQLLPGIEAAGEGNTGFFARGGGADENLILLDEAPVYNPSHILGFMSVFNPDAIKDVTVMTGGIPAAYGGRLSSVLDIRTNDGNEKFFEGSGGIGLLASRLTLQGPIVKEEGSFLVSGRRTYADLFLKLSSDTVINRSSLYFYDMNGKANYRLGNEDRIFLSGYFGRDNFSFANFMGFNWGNSTGTLRWNHIWGSRLFSNTSFIFSDYEYTNYSNVGTSNFELTSGIRDLDFKTDFDYFIQPRNTLKFGFDLIYHTFNPGAITTSGTSAIKATTIAQKYAAENAVYVSHEVGLLPVVNVQYGVRFSEFTLLGPGTVFSYDASGDILDSASYRSGTPIKTYVNLEPRFAMTYLLGESSSIKASYTRTVQYLHLLSNSTATNPNALWIPSSNNVQPLFADQVSLGYFRNFFDNGYEASLEVYYKNMEHLIDYKNGADLRLNPNVESQLIFGRGWSYGAEFLVKKKFGALTGWLSYTLSRTDRQFPGVNDG
ncbi:MAG: TonB-dependent receptor, partial [Bacteroidota bacterium]|nr:TonB-dependent receptor [Bacteroidota bacterium]